MSETVWSSILLGILAAILGLKYYRAKLAHAELMTRFAPLVAADTNAAEIKADATADADRIHHEAVAEADRIRRELAARNAEAIKAILEVVHTDRFGVS